MTVIRPNSVSGITSITAQANEINFFRSNGTLAGLQLNGVNFNTTTGVSTFNNLDVGGVLTYQDVTNVDSLGIGTFRTGINVSGGNLTVTPGYVGINTDATGSQLSVAQSSGNSPLTLDCYGNTRSRIIFRNSVVRGTQTNIEAIEDDLRFITNSGERLRIAAGGNLLASGITTSNTGFMFGTGGQHYLYQSASDTVSLRITSDGPYAEFKDNSGDVQMGSGSGTLRLSAGGNEKARLSSVGEFHIEDRNSSNTGEHFFQAGAFGIRMQDTGGYNWWRLEGNYGGYSQFINLRADRRMGIYATNPTSRVDFGYDSNQNSNAFMQFKGPGNKSGEMRHKRVHNGYTGGGDVNLFEVTQWQSSNSRIFGVVKVMACNPLSNQGYQAEGWFFKSDDGNADQSTMTKVHDKGGSVGSLSWDSDTLRYTTPNTAYLSMHVSVEYHTYDGATVVFDTSSRYL